jgi:hypothetical protein
LQPNFPIGKSNPSLLLPPFISKDMGRYKEEIVEEEEDKKK